MRTNIRAHNLFRPLPETFTKVLRASATLQSSLKWV
jgi:hypothetical protein